MNQREKLLAFAVGGLVTIFVLGFGVRAILIKPLNAIDKKTAVLREKLAAIQKERQAYFVAEEQVKNFAQRTFDDTVDEASAKSGEMLTRKIVTCGLSEADFTRLPVGPKRLPRRRASEIGWSVQGDGPLQSVVNLLFMLHESSRLHRIDNVSLTDGDGPGQVKVRFLYLTLVLEPAPVVEPVELAPKFSLDSPERRLLDGIVQRDLLRPYIKRPPPPPAPPGSVAGAPPGPPPGPEALKIVSLSEWLGKPEIGVLDSIRQRTQSYRPGDPLAGGVIVMVDYRPLPRLDKPGLLSNSRVILKIGNEYWAIEQGRTLAEKYKLAAEQLPENMPKL
jgi:hypothetical protein